MEIVNIAAYKFVSVPDPMLVREPLKALCTKLQLKGTILLAAEGVNLFLAGTRPSIDDFLHTVKNKAPFMPIFEALEVKESVSDEQPFRRMLVRIKKEIITMRHPAIMPAAGRAPAVSAETLERWLQSGRDDEDRPLLLLDTRNAFEVALGTFDAALHLDIQRFSEFPTAYEDAVQKHRIDPANQHIVTFCTGGIRCEKAALFLAEKGATSVTQLDGGILKYFEKVGAAHWHGECFVFDDRVALDPSLAATATVQCYACRAVVTPEEQTDARYRIGVSCPHCASAKDAKSVAPSDARPQDGVLARQS